MASLPEILASLTNGDGSPDLIARRQQLDLMMEQILPSERRYIKARLSAMTCPVDFIPKLPVEILICVSDYMTVADLSATRMVSKAWLGCFGRTDVVMSTMKKHFRMIYETPSFKTATASARQTLFSVLSQRENSINQGKYHSMSSFSYRHEGVSHRASYTGGLRRPPKVSDYHFSENRLAWCSEEVIYIKDLVKGNTKGFVTPDRNRISWFSMHGDSLLATRRTNIYAWSIETGEVCTIKLPSLPLLAVAKDGNALISLRDGNVLQWTIGQCVRQLKIPVQPNGLLFFLCHDPLSEAAFIRCFWQVVDRDTSLEHGSVSKALRLVAEKFVEESVVSSSAIDIPLSEEGRIAFETNPSKTIDSIIKIGTVALDENGTFNATVSSNLTEDCHVFGKKYKFGPSAPVFSFIRFTYNAVEGQWCRTTYAVPRQLVLETLIGEVDLNSVHFAGYQALFPVRRANEFLVIALRPFRREWIPQDPITMRLRYIYGSYRGRVDNRELITTTDELVESTVTSNIHKFGLHYAWAKRGLFSAINLQKGREDCLRETGCQLKICGNSTLTVLLGPTGYIVWCYDKDTFLPEQTDLDREVLGSWPFVPS